jgi:hypothetical protein
MAAREACCPVAVAAAALVWPRAAFCTAADVEALAFCARAPLEVMVWPRPCTVAAVMPAPAAVPPAALLVRTAFCTAACARLLPIAVRVAPEAWPAAWVRAIWPLISVVEPARAPDWTCWPTAAVPVLRGGRNWGGGGCDDARPIRDPATPRHAHALSAVPAPTCGSCRRAECWCRLRFASGHGPLRQGGGGGPEACVGSGSGSLRRAGPILTGTCGCGRHSRQAAGRKGAALRIFMVKVTSGRDRKAGSPAESAGNASRKATAATRWERVMASRNIKLDELTCLDEQGF